MRVYLFHFFKNINIKLMTTLTTIQVTIGKSKEEFAFLITISPGNLPNPISLKNGYNNPKTINSNPIMISDF